MKVYRYSQWQRYNFFKSSRRTSEIAIHNINKKLNDRSAKYVDKNKAAKILHENEIKRIDKIIKNDYDGIELQFGDMK